jgi:hypothetical protein
MKQGRMTNTCVAIALIVSWLTLNSAVAAQSAKPGIVHDSEYYILETQHSE